MGILVFSDTPPALTIDETKLLTQKPLTINANEEYSVDYTKKIVYIIHTDEKPRRQGTLVGLNSKTASLVEQYFGIKIEEYGVTVLDYYWESEIEMNTFSI